MDRGARRDWQVRFAAVVIFVLGFAAGALALNVYKDSHAAESDRREHFGHVLDQLNLTPDQQTKVNAIFDDARAQISDLRKECGPKFRAVREQTDAKLREVLTPEQWAEFQQLTQQSRERHERERSNRQPQS